jgi:hypothetical protein
MPSGADGSLTSKFAGRWSGPVLAYFVEKLEIVGPSISGPMRI